MLRQIVFITLGSLVFLSNPILAQLRGRILPAPGEKELPQEVTVTLELQMEAYEETAVVDRNGNFEFRLTGFKDGVLLIKSEGYASKRVYLHAADRKPYWVIPLGPRVESSSGGPGADGSLVDSRRLLIPKKASKEMEKANKESSKGEFEKAIKHLNKAIKEYPEYVEAYSNLGVIYMKQRKVAEAESAFSKAIEIDPSFAAATKNLGYLRLAAGREDEAIEPLTKAVELAPSDPTAQGFLGEALYQSGRYEEAIDPLKKALELKSDFFRASYRLGYVYVELKKYPEALSAFEHFLETNQGMDETKVLNIVDQLKAALQ